MKPFSFGASFVYLSNNYRIIAIHFPRWPDQVCWSVERLIPRSPVRGRVKKVECHRMAFDLPAVFVDSLADTEQRS